MKNRINKSKIFLFAILLMAFSFGPLSFVFTPGQASAFDIGSIFSSGGEGEGGGEGMGGGGGGMNISVKDSSHISATVKQKAEDISNWSKDYARKIWEWMKKNAIAVAYRKALSNFLNNLAYDTATYLATGGKGQGPMFETENWSEYLFNAADNAAGTFLEELGENGPTKFDLCDPGANVTMAIGMSLYDGEGINKPKCTFTEMRDNWESALDKENFLENFTNVYDVRSNDFGIALSLKGEMLEREAEATAAAQLKRETNQGWLDVSGMISGEVKTPAGVVRSSAEKTLAEANQDNYTYTQSAVADAINIFANSLVSKLMEEWLRKGLSRSSTDTSYKGNYGGFATSGGGGGSSYSGSGGLSGVNNRVGASTNGSANSVSLSGVGGGSGYEADVAAGQGVAKAREEFKKLVEPNFAVKGDYEVLNDLVTCGDPSNAKPDECVVTEDFRRAIENKLTVAEAIKQKYINKDSVFGFRGDGIEPSYNEGFPYRSMLILRKYRIVPVGWELAAQFIKDNQDILHRTFSLYDMVACFDPSNGADDPYFGYQGIVADSPYSDLENSWCKGLVDPSWVFKAPQNYCKREGAGPYIISEVVTGEGNDSSLSIARDESYCADEQTCIKENDDGSCEMYGYCTEDRRKYNFGGESCDANYNTCQTFRAEDGRTISLLKNTLDYGETDNTCNIDNDGCRAYARSVDPVEGASYSLVDGRVLWENALGAINLNAKAEECEEENEGCHQFIRAKSGLGANLLSNGGFEDFDAGDGSFAVWGNVGTVTEAMEGYYAVELSSDISRSLAFDTFDIEDPFVPASGASEYDIEGMTFTLSLYAKGCESPARIGFVDSEASFDDTSASMSADDWTFVSVSYSYPENSGGVVEIESRDAAGCTIDSLKLEVSRGGGSARPTAYSPYGGAGMIYQKLMPPYLFNTCYEDVDEDGFMEEIPNAPDTCRDFARYCTEEELNCDMYTSMTDGFSVPAVAMAEDYCPEECVGYDEYLQSETRFENEETEYFIPDSADTCSAAVAGCDAFTNLDEIDSAENKEYFVDLRACVQPDDPGVSCTDYFMWEGSDESGYQLRVNRLNAPGGSLDTVSGASDCSTNLGSPDYDQDCREFFDAEGNRYTENLYNTVSCTDECHPYRKVNVDDDEREEENCRDHGGTWRTDGNYCLYMTVPSESVTCSAEEAGCREYNGNTGANTRIVLENSFEDGTNGGWSGGVNSNNSVVAGEHSLETNGVISYTLDDQVVEGRSYVIQFLAYGNAINRIYFDNGTSGEEAFFSVTSTGDTASWRPYEFNLSSLDHEVNPAGERLVIEFSDPVNIDNIRLTEVIDRHYLIEDSWEDNCDVNPDDPDAPAEEGLYAGCDAYMNQDNEIHYLYQFSKLCTDTAVGCELMIDTQNSSSYEEEVFCEDDGSNCVTVPADNFVYVVYDEDKSCNAADKGCERLGIEYNYEYPGLDNYVQYFDNFKVNDPDQYDNSLCEEVEVGCSAWDTANGSSFFKDPADMLCEWRIEDGRGLGRWNWLKKEVSRCDASGDGLINLEESGPYAGLRPAETERRMCSTAKDCELEDETATYCESDDDCTGNCVDNLCRDACIMDEHDYPCDQDNNGSDPPKTMGVGGYGNRVAQPLGAMEDRGWAAVCPAGQDGCTEYIDHESIFSFDVDVLKPYTLYVYDESNSQNLQVLRNQGVDCGDLRYYRLDQDDNMLVDGYPVEPGDIFYYASDTNCRFNADDFKIKSAVVDYQLEATIDKSSCNGMVDLDEGCILINERTPEAGGVMADLMYNADSGLYTTPDSPQEGNSANALLKVNPDRACNTWLACRSFVKDWEGNDVCYDVGLCERLDDNGNCSYFSNVDYGASNMIYTANSSMNISNLTGYSKVGYNQDNSLRADYYSLGDMRQHGQLANVPNGSFDLFDANFYPLGWTPMEASNNSADKGWERDMFKAISNPVAAQRESIDYPLDGIAFLKIGAKDGAMSEPISMVTGDPYVMTFYVNTKNMASGRAVIDATQLGGPESIRTIPGSRNWQMYMIPFTAIGNDSPRIRIKATVDEFGNQPAGNFYVDKIEIKPTLNSRDDNENGDQWYTPQTCRLYPESDALSCDYYDDSGVRKKGWPGYCLEYDRYPGNPDACLTWYPVDRVNGDGVEEGGGYIDRQPLYYCTQVNNGLRYGDPLPIWPENSEGPTEVETFVEENNFGAQSSGDIDILHRNPHGSSSDEWTLEQLGLSHVPEKFLRWENISHIRIRHTSPSVYCDSKLSESWDLYFRFNEANRGTDCPATVSQGDCVPPNTPFEGGVHNDDSWLEEAVQDWIVPFGFLEDDDDDYDKPANKREAGIRMLSKDGKFDGIKTSNFDSYCNHPDYHIKEVVIFPNVTYCEQIAQVVTPMGQSRHYSSHIYEGSNYGDNGEVPCNSSAVLNFSDIKYCEYISDLAPFGGVDQPGRAINDWAIMSNPYMWDSRDGIDGKQPLFYEDPNNTGFQNNRARMGQEIRQGTILGGLFSKIYATWRFNAEGSTGVSQVIGQYVFNNNGAETPTNVLDRPIVRIVKTVPSGEGLYANQLVNLQFTSDVHEDHLPMTMYSVDWDDGSVTSVSGVEMRDRPQEENPHSLYHIYREPGTYYIEVKVRDNWNQENVPVVYEVNIKE